MSRALKSEQKEAISTLVSGTVTCRVANWFLEKHDISGDGSYERNNDEKASSVVVVCSIQRIVYDQME